MPELHETMMGRKLIEHTLPDIGDQLKRIADALEKPTVSEDTITIGAYYYIDDAGKKVYDLEEMYEELALKISVLEEKNNI
jgi:hypothetical protein